MTSDFKSIKIKVIDLDENYNFVVDDFFIWNHLRSQQYGRSFDDLKFKFCKWPQIKNQPKLKLQISIRTTIL
jgi:hypothetical protein